MGVTTMPIQKDTTGGDDKGKKKNQEEESTHIEPVGGKNKAHSEPPAGKKKGKLTKEGHVDYAGTAQHGVSSDEESTYVEPLGGGKKRNINKEGNLQYTSTPQHGALEPIARKKVNKKEITANSFDRIKEINYYHSVGSDAEIEALLVQGGEGSFILSDKGKPLDKDDERRNIKIVGYIYVNKDNDIDRYLITERERGGRKALFVGDAGPCNNYKEIEDELKEKGIITPGKGVSHTEGGELLYGYAKQSKTHVEPKGADDSHDQNKRKPVK